VVDVSSDPDYAALLAQAEQRMSRPEIAEALGVDERELDEIASGYVPDDDVARRLQALAESGGRRVSIGARSVSVWLLVVFVVCDLLFFGIAAAVFVLAR
jgi:hypothetical protein